MMDELNIGQVPCRNSICESRYRIDVVKSAAQKYLRRRLPQKMKWCALEMFKFKFGEGKPTERQSIITNLMNRFYVMLDEELCFDDVNRHLRIYGLIQELRRDETDYNRGTELISEICDLFNCGNILRLCNDINCFYKQERFATEEYEGTVDTRKKGDISRFFLTAPKKETGFALYFKNFVGFFKIGDSRCFYWLLKILNMEERNKKSEYIYQVWDWMRESVGDNPKMKKCFEIRLHLFSELKKKSERPFFLIAMVNIFMHREEIQWDDEEVQYTKTELLEGSLEIDDFCIDKHTGAGNEQGKTQKQLMEEFISEGSFVEDEYSKYKNKEWREYYNYSHLNE
jgi:hypothetical protein